MAILETQASSQGAEPEMGILWRGFTEETCREDMGQEEMSKRILDMNCTRE